MRAAEADILIVPGWSGSEEDHWQSRWERSLKTARRVQQEDWYQPSLTAWTHRIQTAVEEAVLPVVLVAHSLGVATAVHAAATLPPGKVVGAYFVAPADVDHADQWPLTRGYDPIRSLSGFSPMPTARLPFPAMLVASANDPYCSLERARDMAAGWGAEFIEAGECGHLNVSSGHGPWPEGLLRFGLFMKGLG
ncbi:MAG: alpha/beta hydrolase [Alphaproteobacteria bacterium BRH_c36]|nr:MAG: alpha/beta hydrolase [Alphaproteobacteria bacterium BRH_c36]